MKGKRTDQQWLVGNRYKMYNPLKQNYGYIKASITGKIDL
ncbi:NERD domain-containing protein [Paenibacillus sp. FSL R10-2796]|nr:NERD domain-containing protein [Paenibacillus odorifer]